MMNQNPLNFLNPRAIQCLGLLSELDDYVTVNTLAESLSISKRTLFRELQDIDRFLQPYSLSLQTKTGLGIRLSGDESQVAQFKRHLVEAGLKHSVFTKEDRQTFLLAELLKNQQLDKFLVYAVQFNVSEATISHDINAIEPQLIPYQLTLVRKPGINLSLEGSEESKRKAIADFIYHHSEEKQFTQLLNMNESWDIESYFKNQGPDSILHILNKEILWNVISVLKENDFFWVNRLAQNAYVGLILHLTIAIERMKQAEPIHMDKSILNRLKKDPVFEKAKELSEYFEDEFNLKFPIEEVAYISIHLKGSRLLAIESENETSDETDFSLPQLENMIFRLIAEFEKISKQSLKEDELLVSGLLTHLRPALTRVKYALEIRNPLLSQIKIQYPTVFENSVLAVKNLKDSQFNHLNEDEIGFIAMHFGAALERLNHNQSLHPLKVAVLCASGIGISSLLSSRIKRIFKDSVHVEPRSHLDLGSIQAGNFDFIVSTMDIQALSLPVLIVNPLLSDDDVQSIQTLITTLTPNSKQSSIQEDEKDWNQNLKLISLMTSHLDGLIQSIEIHTLDSNESRSHLITTLSKNLSTETWPIIENDLKQRELLGDVILEDEKLALFHARSKGVSLPKMAVFRNPHHFDNAFDLPIRSVLVLLVPVEAPMELNRWISRISASLIEDDVYLRSIHEDTVSELTKHVKRLLYDPYREWMRKNV